MEEEMVDACGFPRGVTVPALVKKREGIHAIGANMDTYAVTP